MKKLIALLIFSLSNSVFALNNNEKALLGSLFIYYAHKEINDQPRIINYHPSMIPQEINSILFSSTNASRHTNSKQYYTCLVEVYDPKLMNYQYEAITCVK